MPRARLLRPTEVPHDRGDAALQFVLFGAGQGGLAAICRYERFPDELARRAPVVVASAEQNRRLGEIRDLWSIGHLFEVQDRCDARAIVEDVGGPKVVVDELLALGRP